MTEPSEPAAHEPPPPAAPRPRTGAPWPVVAVSLAVAIVSLAVAAGALLARGESAADVEAVRTSALEAARDRTTALTSYDYRTLEQDTAEVLETATGEFEEDFRSTTARLSGTFTTTQAVATGTVVGAGLESLRTPDDGPVTAVVVVAVDQVIRTTGAAPRTERNRLRMQLVRPEGTWLVSDVERL